MTNLETTKKYLENLFNVLEEILAVADSDNDSAKCCDLEEVKAKLNQLKTDFTDKDCTILYEVALKLKHYQNRVNQSFSEQFEVSDINALKFHAHQERMKKRGEKKGK